MSPTPETPTTAVRRAARGAAALVPGVAVVVVLAAFAQFVAGWSGALSPIVVAVVLGVLIRNVGLLPGTADPGLTFAAKKLLRVGVVLIGFRLALGDLAEVGAQAVGIVVVAVLATLVFTYWLGRRLGLARDLSLLTATGFAICGASAVAAMREVIDADDESPAMAIALVTIFGTLAIFVLPLVATLIGMSDAAFGQWAGASVHDVGQVIATAAAGGPEALEVAVVVKLTRVLMLGPIVAVVAIVWRRRMASSSEAGASRPSLVPLFVVGFLATVMIRTAGLVPDPMLGTISRIEGWVFTAALVGLGAGVRLAKLRKVGPRAVVMGAIAWVFVATVAIIGVMVVHGGVA